MPVKLKAIKPLFGVYGAIEPGQEFEASDSHARYYERRGVAVPVVGAKMQKAQQNKAERGAPANKSETDPTPSRLAGSRTGAAKPASSSQAAPAPKKSTSRKAKAKPAL